MNMIHSIGKLESVQPSGRESARNHIVENLIPRPKNAGYDDHLTKGKVKL